MRNPDIQGKKKIGGQIPGENVKLQTAGEPSVWCCHLTNTNEELGGLATDISTFAELLWLVFVDCRQVLIHIPVDVVDNTGLKQKVSPRHQVVHDEVLIGSDCDSVTNTQRAQHVQHLPHTQYFQHYSTCVQNSLIVFIAQMISATTITRH